MVIELKASTRRSTYLAGESVKVSISIANVIQNTTRYFNNINSRHPSNQTIEKSEKLDETEKEISKNESQSVINTSATNCVSSVDSNDFMRPERVAWVSVYLHCECIVNRNKVAIDNITAALAPVKSVLQQQSPHDFENSSHVFHENGERAEGERVPINGQHIDGQKSGGKDGKDKLIDKQGKDSDSGVGGLQGKAFSPKTSLAPDRDSHGIGRVRNIGWVPAKTK